MNFSHQIYDNKNIGIRGKVYVRFPRWERQLILARVLSTLFGPSPNMYWGTAAVCREDPSMRKIAPLRPLTTTLTYIHSVKNLVVRTEVTPSPFSSSLIALKEKATISWYNLLLRTNFTNWQVCSSFHHFVPVFCRWQRIVTKVNWFSSHEYLYSTSWEVKLTHHSLPLKVKHQTVFMRFQTRTKWWKDQ